MEPPLLLKSKGTRNSVVVGVHHHILFKEDWGEDLVYQGPRDWNTDGDWCSERSFAGEGYYLGVGDVKEWWQRWSSRRPPGAPRASRKCGMGSMQRQGRMRSGGGGAVLYWGWWDNLHHNRDPRGGYSGGSPPQPPPPPPNDDYDYDSPV